MRSVLPHDFTHGRGAPRAGAGAIVHPPRFRAWTRAAWGLTALALTWAYGDALADLVACWRSDPAYSHGFLVPVFSGYLLWRSRGQLPVASDRGAWWGVVPLLGAGAMLLVAAWWYYAVLTPYSLLPCLAGVCLMAGGWPLLRWASPAIGYLAFMAPLPGRLEDFLGEPLQQVATRASTYVVQTLGVPAFAEGNVIVLSEAKIGVVEACSGLRMLILFLALSTAVALLIRRPLWERLLILASGVPIAVLSNVARISATAAVYEWGDRAFAETLFHSVSGWLMMPVALSLLMLEVGILSRLFVDVPPSAPVSLMPRQAPASGVAAAELAGAAEGPTPWRRRGTAAERGQTGIGA